MEIAANPQYSQQIITPNISRQRTEAQPIPRQHHGTDIAQYLGAQEDMRYAGSAPSAEEQYFGGFDAFNFSKGNNVGSILKQAVSFTPQIRENSLEKLRQASPFMEFSASLPQDEQEAAKRYAAAQSSGKTFEDVEDSIKRDIAGDTTALDATLTCSLGAKPADIRTTTAQGTIVTLLTPSVRYNETTAENFSLQVTRKDGFQLILPLDGDVRMNEEEDGSISLYYPASGKRLTYDAEGNEHEEMLVAGEQGTDGDDILINVSGSHVESGSGNDTIFNLADDVSITGEEGNKTIFMGGVTRKNVSIELGDGNHHIYANMLQDSNLNLGNGNNTLAMGIAHGTGVKAGNGDNTLLVPLVRGLSMVLGDGNNTLSTASLSEDSKIYIGSGKNIFETSYLGGNSTLEMGNGDNYIEVKSVSNNSSINCGSGNNTVKVYSLSESALNIGNGNNTLNMHNVSESGMNTGAGNNVVQMNIVYHGSVNMGSGKNTITCDTAVSSQFFIGNDSHTASKKSLFDLTHGATQDAGSTINIKNLNGSALHTGSGNDRVIVENKGGSTINTGAGDDVLYLGNSIWDIAEGVDTGSGRDIVFVKDKLTGQYVDMTHLFK